MGDYQYLEVMKDMGKYIDEYNLFQRIKNYIEALAEKIIVNKVPEKPWMYLTIKFITKL